MKKITVYVEETVKNLPKKLKDDVKKELFNEITEMVESHKDEGLSEDEAIKVVLENLGDPKKLSDKYLDKKDYLIGPRLYSVYVKLLKIVMFAVGLGLLVAMLVNSAINDMNDVSYIVSSLVGLFNALLQVFAWITIIFALVQRSELDEKELVDDAIWTIKDLPKDIPAKTSTRAEGIGGVIFGAVVVVLINFNLDLFGVFFLNDNQVVVSSPLLNQATASSWLPWINAMLAIIIISNVVKVANVTFSKKREAFIIAMQLISLIIFVGVVATMDIINPTLISDVAAFNEPLSVMVSGLLTTVFWVIVVVNVAEVGYKLYKLFKV